MSQLSRSTKAGVRMIGAVLLVLFQHTAALAHHAMDGAVPATLWQGLVSGFGHPVIGLDHFAFLVAIGLLASMTSKPFVLPLAFIGATLCGTTIHLANVDLPIAELLVALSVVIVGVLLIVRRRLPTVPLARIFIVAGICHGYAYGEAIVGAEHSPLLAYLVGLALVQYMNIIGVLCIVRSLEVKSAQLQSHGLRISGAFVMCVGLFFVATHLFSTLSG